MPRPKTTKVWRRVSAGAYALGFTQALVVKQTDGRWLVFVASGVGGFAERLGDAQKLAEKLAAKGLATECRECTRAAVLCAECAALG